MCANAVRCESDATSGDETFVELACELNLVRITPMCVSPACQDDVAMTVDAPLASSTESSTNGLIRSCSSTAVHDVASKISSNNVRISTEGSDFLDFEGFGDDVACDDVSDQTELFLRIGNADDQSFSSFLPSSSSSSRVCKYLRDEGIVRCVFPFGVGLFQELQLYRGRGLCEGALAVRYENTRILESCQMSFASPSVTAVDGCDEETCPRDGGATMTVRGYNFGPREALVFVNGQLCGNISHGNALDDCDGEDAGTPRCHREITCVTPSLNSWQTSANTMLVIQSNQFSSDDVLVRYQPCAVGSKQIESSNQCAQCSEGRFSSVVDAFECSPCASGYANAAVGASQCARCQKNFVAEREGMRVCEECAGGTESNAKRDACVTCGFFYLGEPSGSHCEIPVTGIIIALGGTLVLFIAAFMTYRRTLRLEKKIELHKELVQDRDEEIRLMADAWRISWDQIQIQKQIAQGGGGIVYQGVLSGTGVAVKTILNTENIDLASQKEVRWMQRARHPRLLLFFGCGRAPDRNIFVAIEFMAEGDLLARLEMSREKCAPVPWRERMQYLCDIAEGMRYIHITLNSIHRDLKSENVLLSYENGIIRCKIADFGLSRIVGGHKVNTKSKRKRIKTKRSTFIDLRNLSSKLVSSRERATSSSSVATTVRSPKHTLAFHDAHDTIQGETRVTSSLSTDKLSTANDSQGKIDAFTPVSSSYDVGMVDNRSDMLIAHQENHMTAGAGTPAYMAPELLTREMMRSETGASYSQAVDTFAFGVIMWEVAELRRAWGEEKWSHNIIEAVTSGKRLSLETKPQDPFTAPPRGGYVALMNMSWHQDPILRPTFDKVLSSLYGVMDVSSMPVAKQRSGGASTTIAVDSGVIETKESGEESISRGLRRRSRGSSSVDMFDL